MRKLDGRVVRFIAVDPKYARTPYPAIAPWSESMATYVTGQHIDPSDKTTHKNLTVDEMVHPDKMSATRRALWPYIINPENQPCVMIKHSVPYDCRVDDKGKPINPRDYWDARFIYLQEVTAENKTKIIKSKHRFYLEDKEAEAMETLSRADMRYEAEKLIREKANVSEYGNIIEMLNYASNTFHQPIEGLSDNRMKAILVDQAYEHPERIISVFDASYDVKTFVIDLLRAGILAKEARGYYDGRNYVADTFDDIVSLIKTERDKDLISRWGNMLRESKQISV